MRVLIVLFALILVVVSKRHHTTVCYRDGSICVPTDAPTTGILWKDCAEYCQKCQGKSTGKCEKMMMKTCNGGYHCKCSGNAVPKTEILKEAATCRLGL